ncbi:MAG TPA: hypothetical protein VM490_23885 [Armatimonadaceae bacterium]|nr:hypothetical protein [Armatimonadaceae bacterium]
MTTDPAAAAAVAPPVEAALAELGRRHARALAWLGVRVVALGFLLAVLSLQWAALGRYRFALDALSGVLVLAPYFTAVGRLFAWRIALGRAYLREERGEDAVRTLAVFEGLRARVFDATGEGRFLLGTALRKRGKYDEARRVFADVRRFGGGEWQERAAAESEVEERTR